MAAVLGFLAILYSSIIWSDALVAFRTSSFAFRFLIVWLFPTVMNSILLALVCVRWYRRVLIGVGRTRHRIAWFGARDWVFAAAMFTFYFVNVLLLDIDQFAEVLIGMSLHDWFEIETGLPPQVFMEVFAGLLLSATAAVMFAIFPAIAVEPGRRQFQRPLRIVRSHFLQLVLIYVLGLLPWFGVRAVGLLILQTLSPMIIIDERIGFAFKTLSAWILMCAIALSAAAYRELKRRDILERTAQVFE
jgi:hypothetical protein